MKDHIMFGSEIIEYTLQYTNRKTLGITVKPDMMVQGKHSTKPILEIRSPIEYLCQKKSNALY
jgi:hypothetical protein